jgi:hypothetical protein
MGDNNMQRHKMSMSDQGPNYLEFKGLVVGRVLFLLYLQEYVKLVIAPWI